MKAWRFYGFGDFRLDEIPAPQVQPGHVLVEPLCVQPSVTEAQLAFGIPTLAYERVKRRLETQAPIQLFGHEFSARIIDVGTGVERFRVGDGDLCRLAEDRAFATGFGLLLRRVVDLLKHARNCEQEGRAEGRHRGQQQLRVALMSHLHSAMDSENGDEAGKDVSGRDE